MPGKRKLIWHPPFLLEISLCGTAQLKNGLLLSKPFLVTNPFNFRPFPRIQALW